MDSSWLHPREELVRTMLRIYRYHMTSTSGGNLSILDPDGSIWITPSRVDKGNLKPTDVVRVLADGSVEGLHPPSSEFPFHRQIYERRPDIKAIVHRLVCRSTAADQRPRFRVASRPRNAKPPQLRVNSIFGRTINHKLYFQGPSSFRPRDLM